MTFTPRLGFVNSFEFLSKLVAFVKDDTSPFLILVPLEPGPATILTRRIVFGTKPEPPAIVVAPTVS